MPRVKEAEEGSRQAGQGPGKCQQLQKPARWPDSYRPVLGLWNVS